LKKAIALNTIVYEIISAFGFTAHQTEEVVSLLDSASGKFVNSTTHRILKTETGLLFLLFRKWKLPLW
jgi:tRNA(Ile)-lysidine synthase